MSFIAKDHLIDLKGKDYLQVMWRLVWFREEHPLWNIETELLLHDQVNGSAVFKAVVCDEEGKQKSAGHGSEQVKDFRDYLEKAETKAVGRALAMLGYGTQFAPELDESERIVDSPVPKKKQTDADPIGQCVCAKCGAEITQAESGYSSKNFGKPLCRACQKEAKDAK